MTDTLLTYAGCRLSQPDPKLVLVDRADGGNLVVHPARDVWERSELSAEELTQFSFLVAAAGRAMIDVLPQLQGGCVNYWEAGNWALNDDAEPKGRKDPRERRRMHLHLLGRSPMARSASWQWGESPIFPMFKDRFAYSAPHRQLTADECAAVAKRAGEILREKYGA